MQLAPGATGFACKRARKGGKVGTGRKGERIGCVDSRKGRITGRRDVLELIARYSTDCRSMDPKL